MESITDRSSQLLFFHFASLKERLSGVRRRRKSTPTRKRVEVSLAVKKYICRYKEDHPTVTIYHIQDHIMKSMSLDIGRSTVGDILRERKKWLTMSEDSPDLNRNRRPRHQELEDAVFWWLTNRAHNPTIKDETIIAKAKEIGGQLDIKDFSYSPGWLYRFKLRRGIKPKRTYRRRHAKKGKI